MAVIKASLSEAKAMKRQGFIREPALKAIDTPKHTPVPMFLPTETFGHTVANVVTRERFILDNLSFWIEWRVLPVVAIVLAVLALIAFSFNGTIAAFLAAGSGYAYGRYIWQGFRIRMLLGRRKLLEST